MKNDICTFKNDNVTSEPSFQSAKTTFGTVSYPLLELDKQLHKNNIFNSKRKSLYDFRILVYTKKRPRPDLKASKVGYR